jgi:hypothetical protein
MNDIPGVNDDVGGRIERVYVRNRECEIAYSLVGIGVSRVKWVSEICAMIMMRDSGLSIAGLRSTP